jgi:transcription elongation factor GreA-like protein
MWISWINTEQLLGDFTGTVKKAIEANVGQVVYFRILEVLTEQENWAVAIEFAKKMLKKFNRDPRAYIAFLKMIDQYSRSGHELSDSLSVKEIMKRARQCLKANEVIQIEIHHAKSLFEWKESEQGRNVLEELTTKHPKR